MTSIIGTSTFALRNEMANNIAAEGTAHPRFLDEMFDPLWRMAQIYGIYPPVMIAQSYKETGAGKFTGNVPPTYFNTAGIKVRDTSVAVFPNGSEVPLAHSQYGSWFAGAEAHAQHLYAYMGKALPLGRYLVDPRWVWVHGKHAITQVEELSGKWAPSPTYGSDIVATMNRFSV